MNPLKRFMKGVGYYSLPWRIWLGVLVAFNFVFPILLWNHPEARVSILAGLLAMLLGLLLVHFQGFTRLLGLMHLPWVGLVIYLWPKIEQVPLTDFFGFWIRIVVLINYLSLLIDLTDVLRYLFGERKPLVEV